MPHPFVCTTNTLTRPRVCFQLGAYKKVFTIEAWHAPTCQAPLPLPPRHRPPTSSYLCEPRANLKIMRSIIFTFQLLRLLFISTYKKRAKAVEDEGGEDEEKQKSSLRVGCVLLRLPSWSVERRGDAADCLYNYIILHNLQSTLALGFMLC